MQFLHIHDWMREALDKLKEQLLFESNQFRPLPSPELPLHGDGAVLNC